MILELVQNFLCGVPVDGEKHMAALLMRISIASQGRGEARLRALMHRSVFLEMVGDEYTLNLRRASQQVRRALRSTRNANARADYYARLFRRAAMLLPQSALEEITSTMEGANEELMRAAAR